MKRREFITLLGGAAVAWPLAARAQQPGGMRRIGVLSTVSPAIPWGRAAIDALTQGLSVLGRKEGDNLQIDWRFWGGIDAASMGDDAAQLVTLGPDVLLAVGNISVEALLRETKTIPIVFTLVSDPVGICREPGASRRKCDGFQQL